MTVQFEIFFRLQRIGVWLLRHRLYPLGDVGEDLLCSEHPIGIESRIAARFSILRLRKGVHTHPSALAMLGSRYSNGSNMKETFTVSLRGT